LEQEEPLQGAMRDCSGCVLQVTDDDIEDFRLVWTAFDPSAKGYIRLDKLTNLLKAVSPPLGLQGLPVTHNVMLAFQRKLPLKVRCLFTLKVQIPSSLLRLSLVLNAQTPHVTCPPFLHVLESAR
jgi:Voltage-dependent L-type calcium channel, IQ-associated